MDEAPIIIPGNAPSPAPQSAAPSTPPEPLSPQVHLSGSAFKKSSSKGKLFLVLLLFLLLGGGLFTSLIFVKQQQDTRSRASGTTPATAAGDYTNWTNWTNEFGDLSLQIPGRPAVPGVSAFRAYSEVVFPNNKIKQVMLTADGRSAWYRYATWDGSQYGGWTGWENQYGDLTGLVSGVSSWSSISESVFPDNRIKQAFLSSDKKTVWYRYATWDATNNQYDNWTQWTNEFGDLSGIVSGVTQWNSYSEVVFPNNTLKQALLTADGRKIWYRYATWDGSQYGDWTAWQDEFGDATNLVSGVSSWLSVREEVFPDNRIKQNFLAPDQKTVWYRYATWDATNNQYDNWTQWTNEFGDLSAQIPGSAGTPAVSEFRSYSEAVFPNNAIKQVMLTSQGKYAWHRYATWNGSQYGNWTEWSDQYGDLTGLVSGVTSWLSISEVVFPDKRIKQAFLANDQHTVWYRYATWDATINQYDNWTQWTNEFGDLNTLIPGVSNFRSYSEVVFPDNRLKQAILTADGKTTWYRYATWSNGQYGSWTAWSKEFGDVSNIVPGVASWLSVRESVFPDNRIKQSFLSDDKKTVWYRYATWSVLTAANTATPVPANAPSNTPPPSGPTPTFAPEVEDGANFITNGKFNEVTPVNTVIKRAPEWNAGSGAEAWGYAATAVGADEAKNPGKGNFVIIRGPVDDQGHWWRYEQYVQLNGGTQYTVSARARAFLAAGRGIRIAIDCAENSGCGSLPINGAVSHTVVAQNSAWENKSATFTPPSTGNYFLRLMSVDGSEVYFDDVAITAAGSSTNIVKNGTFDSPAPVTMDMIHDQGVNWGSGTNEPWSFYSSAVTANATINPGRGNFLIIRGPTDNPGHWWRYEQIVGPLEAGQQYTLRVRAKTHIAEGRGVLVSINCEQQGVCGNINDEITRITMTPGSNWVNYSKVFTAPAQATCFVRINAEDGSEAYFDDISIVSGDTACAGRRLSDFNCDRKVNILDYSFILRDWGLRAGDTGFRDLVDIAPPGNLDSQINLLDYTTWLAEYTGDEGY